jgi:hypothetical protein
LATTVSFLAISQLTLFGSARLSSLEIAGGETHQIDRSSRVRSAPISRKPAIFFVSRESAARVASHWHFEGAR